IAAAYLPICGTCATGWALDRISGRARPEGGNMVVGRRTFLGAAAGTFAVARGFPAIAQNAPLRIGCVTTLSGAAGILGRPQRLGMELAARRLNAAGGILGRQVEIIVRDDQSRPNDAVAAVRE